MDKLDRKYFNIDATLQDRVPPAQTFQKRIALPYRLVIHHSAGNELKDFDDMYVADSFGLEGKKLFQLGWQSYLRHPIRNERTWSNAHYALHEHGGRWCVVPLTRHSLSDITWHAGDRDINACSFGLEVCGNYGDTRNKIPYRQVPEAALEAIAEVFRYYVVYLKEETGKDLLVTGHRDHGATECPAGIYDQLDQLQKLLTI